MKDSHRNPVSRSGRYVVVTVDINRVWLYP